MIALIDMTMVLVAVIGALGLVMSALLPLLVSVRRSMKRDVGKANGEGTLIEMTQRNSEQIGIIRAGQLEADKKLDQHLEDHKHGKVWELVVKEKRPEDST